MAGLTTTPIERVRELEAQLTAMAYERERLEQAVLKGWQHYDEGVTWCGYCSEARTVSGGRLSEHADDCLVSALIAKHETP